MRPDVTELRAFYASPLGQMALRFLGRKIRALWPDVRGCAVAGLGYAAPFLSLFEGEARLAMALMPEGQGAAPWTARGAGGAALVSETQLPLADLSVQRMLLVHCLEMCDPAEPLLREVWRVLAPEGKLILVTPNRRGLWARADGTPFGHGRPYSRGQIEKLLSGAMFSPLSCSASLFAPPLRGRWACGSAPLWERAGGLMWPAFSGVLVIEASKQIYALTPDVEAERATIRLFPAGSLAAAAHGRAGRTRGAPAPRRRPDRPEIVEGPAVVAATTGGGPASGTRRGVTSGLAPAAERRAGAWGWGSGCAGRRAGRPVRGGWRSR